MCGLIRNVFGIHFTRLLGAPNIKKKKKLINEKSRGIKYNTRSN